MTTFTVTGMIKLSSYINEFKKKTGNLCKLFLSLGLKKLRNKRIRKNKGNVGSKAG